MIIIKKCASFTDDVKIVEYTKFKTFKIEKNNEKKKRETSSMKNCVRHCFRIKIFSIVFLLKETYFAAIRFVHTRTHLVSISIETNEWEWTVSHV